MLLKGSLSKKFFFKDSLKNSLFRKRRRVVVRVRFLQISQSKVLLDLLEPPDWTNSLLDDVRKLANFVQRLLNSHSEASHSNTKSGSLVRVSG